MPSPLNSMPERLRAGLRAVPGPVVVFCALCSFIPFGFNELLPFTNVALFTDAQPLFSVYRLRDSEGRVLRPEAFKLGSVYAGLRGDSVRRPARPPGAIARAVSRNRYGDVLDETEVRQLVREGMRRHGVRGPVTVLRLVIGPLDAQRVGVVQRNQWSVP